MPNSKCNLCDSPCVEQYNEKGKLKTRIRPMHAMACAYDNNLPNPGDSIEDIMSPIESCATRAAQQLGFPTLNPNALSKCRGDWFEILVSVAFWNYRIEAKLEKLMFVKLPNVRVFDFRHMFTNNVQLILEDLDQSLHKAGSNLTTSNPDILIVKTTATRHDYQLPITNLSIENIYKVLELYKSVAGYCEYQDIVAGIGLKTSLRPDRRLQLVYEANILKSVFFHLKMRTWKNNSTFKYFALTADKIGPADLEALHTAATHTILFVGTPPEKCVDGLYSVNTYQDIISTIKKIIIELKK